jgi:trehalose synthase
LPEESLTRRIPLTSADDGEAALARIIEIDESLRLSDYSDLAFLAPAVQDLREEAAALVPTLRGRKVWMVNSTPQGGGVAEMLPKMVSMLRELGVETEWAVIETDGPAFFELTKRVHNMMHGVNNGALNAADRELFDAVARDNADKLRQQVGPDDILVIHDPQPLGVGALLKDELGVTALWRCHIGLADRVPATRAVWRFLQPYVASYDHAVFSAPEYIPSYLAGAAEVIHPGIDPLSQKNRELNTHGLVGILCNSGLAVDYSPVLTPPYERPAKRLLPDGTWAPPSERGDIGLLSRPIVAQISRWDRLKGFGPLLDAFVSLKRRHRAGVPDLHRRRLEILRLVLAGPDPDSIADDPEGLEVLEELRGKYLALDPKLQWDIALLALPMESRKENALMVNAIQRCASFVVQNSIQEGFGLTATEAMWKRTPVVGSHACGLRQQIRDGLDGRLVADPSDPEGIAVVLDEMLRDRDTRTRMGRNSQRRVYQNFLIFTQLRRWLRTLAEAASR